MAVTLPGDIVAQYSNAQLYPFLSPEELANIPPPGASLQQLQNFNTSGGNTFPIPNATPPSTFNQTFNTPQQGTPSASTGTLPIHNNNLPLPAQPPLTTGGSPLVAQWEAAQNLIGATQTQISRNQNVISFFPEVKNAKMEELAAREKDVAANRSYLQEQTIANEERRAEFEAVSAAQKDTGNLLAVARGQRERDNYAYHYTIAGLSAPIEVKLPVGFKGPMPPGIVEKLQSFAEQLQDKANDAEAMRKFHLEAARIHSANTGLDVSVAAIKSGKVALTLDELEMAARAAGINVDLAQVALQAAQLPPEPGLVWDDTSQGWVSPMQKSLNESQAKQQAENAMLGELGSIPRETLVSMALTEPPTISDEQLRQGLISQGIPPATADYYVNYVRNVRAKRTSEGSTDIEALLAEYVKNKQQGTTTTTTPSNYTPYMPDPSSNPFG